jgi:hypothetical protein
MTTFNQSSYLTAWRSYNIGAHIADGYGPAVYPNLVDRGDCESTTPPALAGQTTNALTNCTFARNAGQSRSGSFSYLFTKTAGAGNLATAFLGASTGFNGLKPTAYSMNIYVYVPASGFTKTQIFCALGYIPYTGTGTVENVSVWNGIMASWQNINSNLIIPPNATAIYAYIGAVAASGANTFYVDDISVYDLFNTTQLPNATLNIYDGRQPQSADFPLYTGTNLCAQYSFPNSPKSVISPHGIDVLERLPTSIALVSSKATWARVNNFSGAPLFDCSVGLAEDNPDIIISQNPFTVGNALNVSDGDPVPGFSAPTLGNKVRVLR